MRNAPDTRQDAPLRGYILLPAGLALAAGNAVWMTYTELAWNQGYASILSLYYNSVSTLLLLLGANRLLRALPGGALRPAELLVLYAMATMATAIAVNAEYLMAAIGHPAYFAERGNDWAESLLPHLPSWLTVRDPAALNGYYQGHAEAPWPLIRRFWLGPCLAWGSFVLALTATSLCLAAIVFNRWRHQERLPFPLVQIPLMMVERRGAPFRAPLFRVGFALAAGIVLLNALHHLAPTIPELIVKRNSLRIDGLMRPWSALSETLFSFNPLLLGMEFFLPMDLLFSVAAFYLIGRLQGVALLALGQDKAYSPDSMVAPLVREQALGAALALLAFSLWTARGRWRESWTRDPTPFPLGGATAGAGIGTLFLVLFLGAAGLPLGLAALFVLLHIAVALAFAHIRAQYGPPAAGLFEEVPGPALFALLGRGTLGADGLGRLSLLSWWGSEYTDDPLPASTEALALSERRFRPEPLFAWLLLSAATGYAAACATALAIGYASGHATAHTGNVLPAIGGFWFDVFNAQAASPLPGPQWEAVGAMGAGAGVTLLLQALRTRFLAFPLHPVGYAVGSSYVAPFLWSTCLLTALFKGFLLRYFGQRGYQSMAPFFLGLLLGDIAAGSLVSLLSLAVKENIYVFWPY